MFTIYMVHKNTKITNRFIYLIISVIFLLLLLSSINKSIYCSCQNMICKRIPNLNRQQMKICEKNPEILSVIRKGIQIALFECQQLFNDRLINYNSNNDFQSQMWNCSSWIQNSLNRLYVNITDNNVKGTKEASFAHALFAAAVVYTISDACTQSNFPYCTCRNMKKDFNPIDIFDLFNMNDDSDDTNKNYDKNHNHLMTASLSSEFSKKSIKSQHLYNDNNENHVSMPSSSMNQEWKWNGCTNNIQFGVETARLFLDSSEHQTLTPYSLINLHNNNVGRKVIRDGLIYRCQCHGFSGTCTLRTCWHTIHGFRHATQLLYNRYIDAKMVSYKWLDKKFQQKYAKHINNNNNNEKYKNKKNNQLKQIKKLIQNISMLDFNHPNYNRFNHLDMKASKKDLIYIKPSLNLCKLKAQKSKTKLMKRHLTTKTNNISLSLESNITQLSLPSNSSLLSSSSSSQSKPLICTVTNITNSSVNHSINSLKYNDNNYDNDSQQPYNQQHQQQWPPIEPCDKICCNLGYRKKQRLKTYQCDCVFQFCCTIVCKSTCSTMTTEYECIND